MGIVIGETEETMRWEVILRTRENHEYYIVDNRSTKPGYKWFDTVCRDEPHTVLPNKLMASRVADAYRAWAAKYAPAGLALDGQVIIRYVQE